MKKIWFVALYTALALFANTAMAADRADLEALREDTMKKLVFVSAPEAVPATEFGALEGGGFWRISGRRGARLAAKRCPSLMRFKANLAAMILR
jgi:hypothetical protein